MPHLFSIASLTLSPTKAAARRKGLVSVAAKGHVLPKQHLVGLEIEQLKIPGGHPTGTLLICPSVQPLRKKYSA